MLLKVYLNVYFSIEDEGGGAGHIYVIVCLSPLDVERATIHHNTRFPVRTTCEYGCYSRSASACTAGLGDATASFPNTGANAAVGLNTCELDVATLGEGGMDFQGGAGFADLIHIIRKDDVVWIAHRDKRATSLAASC